MPMINCYVDEATLNTLKAVGKREQRTIEDLAECAISEAACAERRAQPEDHRTDSDVSAIND